MARQKTIKTLAGFRRYLKGLDVGELPMVGAGIERKLHAEKDYASSLGLALMADEVLIEMELRKYDTSAFKDMTDDELLDALNSEVEQ